MMSPFAIARARQKENLQRLRLVSDRASGLRRYRGLLVLA